MLKCLALRCILMAALGAPGLALAADGKSFESPSPGARSTRVALVVGNGAYKTSPLRNPPNDADDMAAALREAGFEVISRTNVNQRDMKAAVREFGQRLRGAEAGLFYFAGHGVQVKGVNYLVPVAVDIESEAEAEDQTVSLDYVLRVMEESGAKFNVAVLDACRNNPFSRSFRSAARGLASTQAASGMLIAYATAPGSVAADGEGRNGIYTKHLLKNLKEGDNDILKVFQRVRTGVVGETTGKQTPWETTSLVGEFYMGARVTDTQKLEMGFWDSIKASQRAEDYQAFLDKFPEGAFSQLAKNRISQISARSSAQVASVPTPPPMAAVQQPQGKPEIIVIDGVAGAEAGEYRKATDGKLSCAEIESEQKELQKSQREYADKLNSARSKGDVTDTVAEAGRTVGIPFSGLFGKIVRYSAREENDASMRRLAYYTKRSDHLKTLALIRDCSITAAK